MTDGKTTWRVGELATATGVSVRTLRHYDEVGLLSPSARVGDGPRRYTPADVQRLHHILALRGLGLALVDIAAVIDKTGMDVTDLPTRQLLQVEQQLASSQGLRRVLRALLSTLPAASDSAAGPDPNVLTEKIQEMTDIMTRPTPQQRHELEQCRRRMLADLPEAEFAKLHEGRRRPMAQLSPKEYTALQARRTAVMPDHQ